jgi:alkanesulfonate monooxygenase SsuD/methylene tetrahydromethanopterin reductase-like flavin-dependent oxidoreductase (luciferase family)
MKMRVGVGGSPESVIRAARLGIPMALAIIGGDPARFAPYANLYYEALEKFGQKPLPISIHSPGHVAATDAEARELVWPHYEKFIDRLGRERGWGPASKGHYIQEVEHGSLYVGSPDTVAEKIAHAILSVGASRFDMKFDNGTVPHEHLLKSIELYATEVVPRVRKLLAEASVDVFDSAFGNIS